jgi:hypothetical protein
MRSGEEKKEDQKNIEIRKIVPDFERWPKSWMGTQEDLEYGEKLLPFMEEFMRYLMAQDLSRKTLKVYIDNVWILGGTIIRDVSMNKDHNEDPREKILEAVEYEGCLPDHYGSMSEGELASFERRCKKFEKFLKGKCRMKGA